jgi:hypothetical protein
LGKFFLFQIVPACEDHGRQQTVKKYFLTKREFGLSMHKIGYDAENNTNENAEASLMNEMNLSISVRVHACVKRRLPRLRKQLSGR